MGNFQRSFRYGRRHKLAMIVLSLVTSFVHKGIRCPQMFMKQLA